MCREWAITDSRFDFWLLNLLVCVSKYNFVSYVLFFWSSSGHRFCCNSADDFCFSQILLFFLFLFRILTSKTGGKICSLAETKQQRQIHFSMADIVINWVNQFVYFFCSNGRKNPKKQKNLKFFNKLHSIAKTAVVTAAAAVIEWHSHFVIVFNY